MKNKKLNWKDIGRRAAKTFAQAFIGTVSTVSFVGVKDLDTFKAVAISTAVAGISAGVSAVWNMAREYINKELIV